MSELLQYNEHLKINDIFEDWNNWLTVEIDVIPCVYVGSRTPTSDKPIL